jgi:hypothetical protein
LPKRLDIVGQTFDRLIITKFVRIRNGKSLWECLCTCGNEVVIVGHDIINGHTRSCGCIRKELARKNVVSMNTTHGMSNTNFYKVWRGMLTRCYNVRNKDYKNYGGRGIIMCERWLDFNNFKEDMYESYLKHIEEFGEANTSLDRIEVMGNYEPFNCKWSTMREQNRNTRITSNTNNYDEHQRQRNIIMGAINHVLFGNQKTSKYESYFGCSVEFLRQHIESQFIEGMTWSNHGKSSKGKKVWQLDHIIPVNKFDLSKEEDCKACWNYTNLRPSWWEDNIKRSKLGYND